MSDGDPCDAVGAFGVVPVDGDAVGPSSLKENGTEISRPSNSGIATCIAASIGDSAASDLSQTSREVVRHRPWTIGLSRAASAPTSQASSSPPAPAAEATDPPAASTVTTRASARPSSSSSPSSAPRSDPQKIGSALAPLRSRASQRVSTNAVLPDSSCAR